MALCWVHEARHYKKLSPFVGFYQQTLDKFLGEFWDYYRELVAYRDSPSPDTKQELKTKFYQLFGTETGYKQLDERKKLTAAKESELLLVLEYPNLPLHNNPAELAARTMVQRRKISYATQTSEGTK
ncbi:IS66 family transposase, partial [Nostoc sp.]